MIDPRLDGRVAIVTGANHGIGAATARALAAQGVAVFITYLRLRSGTEDPSFPASYAERRAQTADSVVEAIRRADGRATAWEADLADPAVPAQLFERAEAAFGPVEILVNNAAHSEIDTFVPREQDGKDWAGRPLLPVTAASHDEHFAVNSRAVALMMAEFARRYVGTEGQWGRIINLSTGGAPGFAGEVSYGASKAALESYSRAAAIELGPLGITVNVVSPGPVQTGWIAPDLVEELARGIPLGRVGQPEDIADVIVFLASDGGRWVNGQVLHVGGGSR